VPAGRRAEWPESATASTRHPKEWIAWLASLEWARLG